MWEVIDLGVMYERRRNDLNQNTVNVIHTFSALSIEVEWWRFSAKCIETTESSHDQIETEGTLSVTVTRTRTASTAASGY
jgi:hypothetical protein